MGRIRIAKDTKEIRTSISIAGIFAAISVGSHAATISWSSTAFLTDSTSPWALVTGQFNTTGTQILAENSGGGAVSFDGINFTTPTVGVFDDIFPGFYDSSLRNPAPAPASPAIPSAPSRGHPPPSARFSKPIPPHASSPHHEIPPAITQGRMRAAPQNDSFGP